MNQVLKRHIALPQDHGSWVFLFSPLLVGLFAGGGFSIETLFLIVCSISVFLIRQPITVLVKIYSGRRPSRELTPAIFWSSVYGFVALIALLGLVSTGNTYLLLLAIPGVPVFSWHLWLVSKRSERRQMGVEIIASGVLALSAPAAYWVGIGEPEPLGWVLFLLIWLQSAASIVYAYLRLNQREWRDVPPIADRIRAAQRSLLYTSFNVLFAITLAILSIVPSMIFIPFLLQWLETVYGTLSPAVRQKPTRIGVRQLLVSTIFTILFILTWNLPS